MLKVALEGKPFEAILGRELAIVEEIVGDFVTQPNPIQRLNQVIDWLNQRHYRARWEASGTGPRIIMEHCPYLTVQEEFPDICRIDGRILSHLAGVQPENAQLQSLNTPGVDHCIFMIG
jgi:predicted ArsR family transcriptional regulator